MKDLLKGATSQFVDTKGKCRVINYAEQEVSLITSPLPPFRDLPISRELDDTDINTALSFIKDKELKIISQDGTKEGGIKGLWLEHPQIQSLYMPLEEGEEHLSKIRFESDLIADPLRTDAESELEDMRVAQKVALVLKKYVLYAYSLDPHSFGESSMKVVKDYKYDLEKLDKRLSVNDIMFSKDKKLIVPSQEIKASLIQYLEKTLLNNTQGVMAMADQKVIVDYYSSLSDFRQEENQLVFFDVQSVERWRQESSRIRQHNQIYPYLLSDAREPYFYNGDLFEEDKIVLIQNTEQFSEALAISEKWNESKINLGYRAHESPSVDISYVIYSQNGEVSEEKRDTAFKAHVIEYYDGGYGAILEL